MDYLARNELIVRELNKNSSFKRGEIVGKSSLPSGKEKTIVTRLGSYHSEILGQELYLALKEHKLFHDVSDKLTIDLALIQTIASKKPELLEELPLFYALLQSQNQPIGIITEDFSLGGRYKVRDISEFDRRNIPWELAEIVENPKLKSDKYELAKVGFLVREKRRLGDFGELFLSACLSLNELLEKFPIEQVRDSIERHTVNIDYRL